jgi:hypothetical protein
MVMQHCNISFSSSPSSLHASPEHRRHLLLAAHRSCFHRSSALGQAAIRLPVSQAQAGTPEAARHLLHKLKPVISFSFSPLRSITAAMISIGEIITTALPFTNSSRHRVRLTTANCCL